MRYLTGCTNESIQDYALLFSDELGILIQPGNSYHLKIQEFGAWAADNGCFAAKWNEKAWWAWLVNVAALAAIGDDFTCEITGEVHHTDLRETCLFAVAPDIVGKAAETLEKSSPWLERIRGLGLPVAFVAQDGAELDPEALIPWGKFDVLFIGGSTEFKVDPARGGLLAALARARGIEVHMGRVNSAKRLALADSFGCSSADGTFIGFAPERNVDRMAGWFDKLQPFTRRKKAA